MAMDMQAEVERLSGALRATHCVLVMCLGELAVLRAAMTGGSPKEALTLQLGVLRATLPGALASIEAEGRGFASEGYEDAMETIARIAEASHYGPPEGGGTAP
jgi:hypothetical protein